ncbi:glycosyltransferase [Nakamurella multipartita]|uniref:4,4'-diaponeurosporenoate glycosyltransferase n=1 Tax=Nakamurella multipartita (strain ATCC 700099 / DSM 44233 / CIP 104796 / JCM 9543 / NBRC 105858 / Y-104) TaxID=479431 RepID=C8XKW4_NAKMY|nr:glycosyltransferase family 2 protein [Nakamurella multipartita]ACV80771.1 glycosyl transferase family 2 [Nakamurella multipartita DSM 44233]
MVSIVIPAHNEERGIPRLLEALGVPNEGSFEVIVVANGCNDATVEIATKLGATVIETPEPSKIKAIALGDTAATTFPRLYVDGDVMIDTDSVVALCERLTGGVHAAGPERILPMGGVSLPVRWYYDIWGRLDGVRTELYGRGVIAVDQIGHARLADWQDVMADDGLIAMSFAPHERVVVRNARVTIWPPKTYRDLLRRRIRVATGNAMMAGQPSFERPSGASARWMLRLAVTQPVLLPKIAVFAGTTAIVRLRKRLSRRTSDRVWLRDESSRV